MNTRVSRYPQLRGSHAISVYDLDHDGHRFVATSAVQDTAFDLELYSKFKYGQKDAADYFGNNIAQALTPHLWPVTDYSEPVVVTGTPYKRVSNAAQFLAINAFRILHRSGRYDISYASIYQPRLAAGDYGKMSQADRDKRNQAKVRAFDPDDFAHKHVVLVDDVRITGSIERSTIAMLKDIPTLSITCANLVRLNQETALRRPDLEHELNHYYVSDVGSLWLLMVAKGGFAYTTRALKFILEAPSYDIETLIEVMSSTQLYELYMGIIEEGYDQMPQYKDSFAIIANARKLD